MLSDQTRYSRLANITKIINTKLELREVLQRVTMAISEEIVRCDAVGIYLPEEDGTFRGFAGKPETINGVTLDTQVIDPEVDLLAKEVIETKKTIYIPDTSKDHRPDPRPVDAFKIKSLLALPISFGQELFGLVFLFDYGVPMNLTDSEIQSVEAYVNMAAHLLDPLDKTTIKTTELSSGCDWIEAEWMEKSYEAKIQEIIRTKHIDSKGLLMIPLVSMGEVLGVIVVGKEEKTPNYDDSRIQLAKSIVDATAPTFSNLLYMDQLESMVEERTRELAAANEKVTSVIESITDGFLTLNNKWEFTYVNKHQHFPQRKTAKDVLGKNIWDVFPSSVDTVIYKELHRVMSERTTVHFEFFSTSDEYWHEVIAYPYDDGICCICKNITEKKQYEQELKRLSNIELIGQMAAGISHEIRNPMTTIRGFLQLLKEENNYEKHNNYFNLMVEELDRANSIITEFLSIGNTKKSDLQMLDLNSIIHDIIPLIKIDTHNQNKYIQVDTNDVPALLLNRNEIRQLLMNLYRNGLEAMSTGKTLTISTYKEGQNCVVLAVRDEGKGISSEVLEKLGTPFYTTKENGTGLGLGVCYAIATRHNAKIEIQTGSEGTTFFVKFNYENNKK
ncbi:GAF domain-containing protein [Bacillus cereus]|nr:GAF domain-containing protein [Bacillus cereus]